MFTDNSGNAQGGAMYVNGQNATLYYCNVKFNKATKQGGGILWEGGHGDDRIIGCNISSNVANKKSDSSDLDNSALGGGIFWTSGSATTEAGLIQDSYFYNNSAGKHGGAIDWYRCVGGLIENCTFVENICLKDGAAMYLGDTSGYGREITVANCTFEKNHGANGGAISNQMTDSLIINNTFIANYASNYGGSILMKDGIAHGTLIFNCTF